MGRAGDQLEKGFVGNLVAVEEFESLEPVGGAGFDEAGLDQIAIAQR